MEEDTESSDISAAELAAISNRGQYARSISLALSANVEEDFEPVTLSSEQDDGCQPSGVSSGTTGAAPGQNTAVRPAPCEDEVGEQKDALRTTVEAKDDEEVQDGRAATLEGCYTSQLSGMHCRGSSVKSRHQV